MLGTIIKQRREELGLTQSELSDKAGVTRKYIYLLETGKAQNPTLEMLRPIAQALEMSLDDLCKT